MDKQTARWYSHRVESDVSMVRWGHWGTPLIVFPTAGGDAEEIERMWLVDSVREHIDAGRVKLYSCDSVAGAAMLRGEGSPLYRGAMLSDNDFVLRLERRGDKKVMLVAENNRYLEPGDSGEKKLLGESTSSS